MTKTCTKCHTPKSQSDFSKNCWECRQCASKRVSAWQATKGKDKHSSRCREYKEKHPKRVLLTLAKARAIKSGREFNIEEGDFDIPTHCPILGIELKRSVGKVSDTSPTLDRIDSKRGYVPGNVIVTSFRANSLRKDGSLEEFRAIIEWMVSACSGLRS